MPSTPLRRPRFLGAVPGERHPQAARFLRADPPASRPSLAERTAGEDAAEAPGAVTADLARGEAMEKIAAALQFLRAQASRLAEQARADALEIGFQVARRILESELRTSPEPLFALVRTALRRAGDSRRISLRLSPQDAASVQSDDGQAALEGVSAARVEVFPDPSLAPGDCVVETDYGQIDGRLETRLGELRRAVESSMEGAA
jgi:flagellar assembly protein FliH